MKIHKIFHLSFFKCFCRWNFCQLTRAIKQQYFWVILSNIVYNDSCSDQRKFNIRILVDGKRTYVFSLIKVDCNRWVPFWRLTIRQLLLSKKGTIYIRKLFLEKKRILTCFASFVRQIEGGVGIHMWWMTAQCL